MEVQAPGVNRIIRVAVNGSEFGYRRPSKADEFDIYRRWVAKLFVTGLVGEADMLNSYQGRDLLRAARFEVLLVPRGKVNLGERAPDHWRGTEGEIAFDQVEPEEFDAVAVAIEAQLRPQNPIPATADGKGASEGNV